MVKLRIMSDLHYTAGINGRSLNETIEESCLWKCLNENLNKNNEYITLIAGDICEGLKNHIELLEGFFPNQQVIFIDGNHVVYFRQNDGSKPILSEIKNELKKQFPIDHLFWHYLENNWMWLDSETAIIGSTFYTDYEYCDLTLEEINEIQKQYDVWSLLYGLPHRSEPLKKLTKRNIRRECMIEASVRLNDFKWGKENNVHYLSPEYYLKLHKLAKKEVKRCHDEICALNPNTKIILMTHHCLSPKCISEEYKKGLMNASYTSDLEKWVDDELNNVKLVISGHVHNRNDFTFGKRNVRYICNPCGYIPYQENTKGVAFNPNFIIDTNDL